MSKQFHRSRTGDVVSVPDVLAAKYAADPEWSQEKPKAGEKAAAKKES